MRRRVFEDGQGVDPALILGSFEGIQRRDNGKRKLEENPPKTKNVKKTKTMKKKVVFQDEVYQGNRDDHSASQDAPDVPISFKFSTPLSQRDFEHIGETAAQAPTDAAHGDVPDEGSTSASDEQQDDIYSANIAGASSSGLRHATAKITEGEITEIMKHAQPDDAGNYHCAFFVGCTNVYGVRSTFKRHLRDAHSREKAICPKCRVPLARDDKFTRERHRCQ